MTRLLITGVTVCDVEAATLVPDRNLLLTDGRIERVGGPEVTDDAAETLDLRGRTLVPGLIDAHVHVTAANADLGSVAGWSPSYVTAHAAGIMRDMLHRGFTTVRDVGGADFGLAAAVDEGLLSGPRLVFGGKSLSQTGGHADLRGPGQAAFDAHHCCPSIGVVCDGVDAVRRHARDQLRTGAHHIKLMLSGGVASPTDRVDSTQFSDDEITAAVQEADAANRYVTGHAYTARAVNRALRLGVRCIEHGNLIDGESIELFVRHDAYLVPTLVTYEFLASEGAEAGLPAASQAKVESVRDAGLSALERAWRGDVSIAFGTDLLGDMHRHQSEEFRIRAKVQPPAEVLRAATTTAANLLRMEGEIGVIAPGAHADLLVVDGDPLSDATVLAEPESHVRAVIKGGNVVLDRLGG